jgi:hypothetical protein
VKKHEDKMPFTRVDSQPLTETAELPQRPTEDVPPTAPDAVCRECRRPMRWTSLYGDWCAVCCPRDL